MKLDELKALVLDALDALKGNDIEVLNVAQLTDMADIMIVVSGTSSRHVKALANNVVTEVKAQGILPVGVEGEEEGAWVLVDLGDILIHIMLPETRDFYAIEKLWGVDAESKMNEE
ncbi:MAG: ribosome silencing factor [Cellvibrionales bacterium]|nr:ribosome silencing factor [Cellvibrionales bacterium]